MTKLDLTNIYIGLPTISAEEAPVGKNHKVACLVCTAVGSSNVDVYVDGVREAIITTATEIKPDWVFVRGVFVLADARVPMLDILRNNSDVDQYHEVKKDPKLLHQLHVSGTVIRKLLHDANLRSHENGDYRYPQLRPLTPHLLTR